MNAAPVTCPDASKPVCVSVDSDVRWATLDTWQAAADELVALHPGKVPSVIDTTPAPAKTAPLLALVPAPTQPKAPPSVPGGSFDSIGEARSLIDLDAAAAAGFSPAATVYRRGLRVIDIGVENARASREEHDALPAVGPACTDFIAQIVAEKRDTIPMNVADTRMTKDGLLALRGGARLQVTEHAFGSLVGYQTGIGGSGYLQKCWPELRAINYNHWVTAIGNDEIVTRNKLTGKALEEWSPRRMALRTREAATGPREVFAVVSPSYPAFDVDKIAAALRVAMPDEARCSIVYDGRRATFDIQFHSNVQPHHYVAGEFFKAGIRVRTDDTGGGSIVGSTCIFQNLCLNLIIIDRQEQSLFRIRHMGSIEALAKKFREGIEGAMLKLDHFLRAWDYAVETNVLQDALAPEGVDVPMSIEEALPGLFNGIIERELVPVRGKRTETIPQLIEMWKKDTSAAAGATRGAIVNAFTRYAHEVESDPFEGDLIERSVSKLLYGRTDQNKPARLPYVPVDA